MSEAALIQRDDSKLSVAFTPAATELKENALSLAALVGKVTNAAEQAVAVDAQGEIQRVLSLAEKARKQTKEPVLDFGRKIDDAAKRFKAELDAEMLRIGTMVGDFQQLEQAKARAAENARNAEISRLERERAEAAAKATSHEALDAIDEHFSNKAAALEVPIIAPARAEGQVVRQDWDIQITDIWMLARAHPTCVKIEPRLSEIKELLKASVDVRGIKVTPITKSSVRVSSTRNQLIEV